MAKGKGSPPAEGEGSEREGADRGRWRMTTPERIARERMDALFSRWDSRAQDVLLDGPTPERLAAWGEAAGWYRREDIARKFVRGSLSAIGPEASARPGNVAGELVFLALAGETRERLESRLAELEADGSLDDDARRLLRLLPREVVALAARAQVVARDFDSQRRAEAAEERAAQLEIERDAELSRDAFIRAHAHLESRSELAGEQGTGRQVSKDEPQSETHWLHRLRKAIAARGPMIDRDGRRRYTVVDLAKEVGVHRSTLHASSQAVALIHAARTASTRVEHAESDGAHM